MSMLLCIKQTESLQGSTSLWTRWNRKRDGKSLSRSTIGFKLQLVISENDHQSRVKTVRHNPFSSFALKEVEVNKYNEFELNLKKKAGHLLDLKNENEVLVDESVSAGR